MVFDRTNVVGVGRERDARSDEEARGQEAEDEGAFTRKVMVCTSNMLVFDRNIVFSLLGTCWCAPGKSQLFQ